MRKPLAQLMIDHLQTYRFDIKQFDAIIPIPLFSSRLRERGYNQSLLLAEEIGRKYQIDLSIRNLVRTRNTQHQTLLSKK